MEEQSILIQRPIYSQQTFESQFSIKKKAKKKSISKSIKNRLKVFHPKNFLNVFTIINLITEYEFKNNLVSDLISGVTIGNSRVIIYRKRLNMSPPFFHACTWLMYEVHALKKG